MQAEAGCPSTSPCDKFLNSLLNSPISGFPLLPLPLQVNNNGVVSFGTNVSQYTPDPFPLDGGSPFVAPYWADVNNVLGGNVYWRQTQDQQILSRCTADINQYFPNTPFTAIWALIATWDRVAYFGTASKKVGHSLTSIVCCEMFLLCF